MRAFYATHSHVRIFVFGVPEGWHVGVYDLRRKQWTQMNGSLYDTLKEAKTAAEEHVTGSTGEKLSDLKWH